MSVDGGYLQVFLSHQVYYLFVCTQKLKYLSEISIKSMQKVRWCYLFRLQPKKKCKNHVKFRPKGYLPLKKRWNIPLIISDCTVCTLHISKYFVESLFGNLVYIFRSKCFILKAYIIISCKYFPTFEKYMLYEFFKEIWMIIWCVNFPSSMNIWNVSCRATPLFCFNRMNKFQGNHKHIK